MQDKRDLEIAELLKRGEITFDEIGRRYGLTNTGVDSLAKRLGIERPSRYSKAGRVLILFARRNPELMRHKRKRAVELYAKGFGTFQQIAEHMNVSRGFVAGAVYHARKWRERANA